jgi:hypothetical protein
VSTEDRQSHGAEFDTASREDILANGQISAMRTTFSVHLKSSVELDSGSAMLPSAVTKMTQSQWHHLCALEFIGAYRNFYKLAKHRQQHPPPDSHPITLFLPDTAAYQTMSSHQPSVVRPVMPILLLHIVLFDLRDSSTEELTYQYWAFRRKFDRCDIERDSGLTYLLYAIGMTPDMKAWSDPAQMALLSRLLSVEVRLSRGTRDMLRESLIAFLESTQLEDCDWCSPEDMEAIITGELHEA